MGVDASGDPHGWIRAAVDRYERPLVRYATRLLGDAERARDVAQDAFLKLCTQDRGDVEHRLAEWLFTVCRNRALDILRKEGRMTRLSDDHMQVCESHDPGPAAALERREDAARVLALMGALPASQQEVIRLKFQNGFSYREISRISGHSVTNVGYLLHAGLKTIRTRMAAGQPNQALS